METWLKTNLRTIEWAVLVISWVGISYATHHYDNLTHAQEKLDVVETQNKEITHAKVIREKNNALPPSAISGELSRHWTVHQ